MSAREPRRRLLILAVCYLIAAPVLLVFLTNPGFGAVIATVSLFSLIRGCGEASEKPALCLVVPDCYRATAFGLMNTFATAAGGVGVFLAGWLKRDLGLSQVFAACSIAFLIAAVILFAGYRFLMARDVARARAYESREPGPSNPSVTPLVNEGAPGSAKSTGL